MAHHIKKSKTIAGISTTIYYQGDKSWTTKYASRKTYADESSANAALYTQYQGTVVAE